MTKRPQQSSGFTLIEILAATAIMSIVILVTLSLTTNILTAWNHGTGKLTSNYEARVALDLLDNDLESLVLRNRKMNWLYAEWREPELGSGGASSVTNAVPVMPKLYFMAPAADRPRFKADGSAVAGDVCAITYQVAYQNPFTQNIDADTDPIFALYRFIIDPENTFEFVMDPFTFEVGTTTDWLNARMANSPYLDENGEDQGPAGGVTDFEEDVVLSAQNFISANVVDFDLVFRFSTSTGGTDVFPPLNGNVSVPADGDKLHISDQVYFNGTAQPGLALEYIDISITVMSEEGLAIVERGSYGEDDNNWNDLVARYGNTYTRRVQVMAKAL